MFLPSVSSLSHNSDEASHATSHVGVQGMQLTIPDLEQPDDAVDEAWAKFFI